MKILDFELPDFAADPCRDVALQALEEQILALRDAGRRKDEFLAMLAHELRNPLASVSQAVALLRDSADGEERAWAVDVITRQTGQLSRLIDDLMDVSRIASGKMRLRKEPLDLAAVLDGAVEAARPLIAARNHDLKTDYPRGKLLLEGDPSRLEQIVLNLLANAAKYTPPGGHISVRAVRDGGDLVVTVSDDGIGIAPEKLPEIFDLFAQGGRSIDQSDAGLGVGLTIVRKLAELHGGTIRASSAGAGLGSEFSLRLPMTGAPSAALKSISAGFAFEGSRQARILIVEDHVDLAVGLRGRLKSREG